MDTPSQLNAQHLPYRELEKTIVALCTHSRIDSPHYHSDAQLWYTLEGTYRFNVNQVDYVLPHGSLLFIPPYAPHFIDTLKYPDKKLVCCTMSVKEYNDICATKDNPVPLLSFSNFGLHINGEPRLSVIQLAEKDTKKADTLFMDLLKMQNDNISKEIILHLISSVMSLFPRSDSSKLTTNKISMLFDKFNAITTVVTYIFDNYAKTIISDDMNKMAMMSRSVFFRSFQMITGVTFVTFLNSLRIRNAQLQLTFADNKLDSIAAKCGFTHQSHMIHAFKKNTSRTPAEFRALSRSWYEKYWPDILSEKNAMEMNQAHRQPHQQITTAE